MIDLKDVEWQVWSTGLETWERIRLTEDDAWSLVVLYVKGDTVIYRDELNRFVRSVST
jgi:hypothetical protein